MNIKKDILVDFENIEWENPTPGVRYKAFVRGNQRLRLLDFMEGFEEKEWCIKGHAAYVLDGEFSLYFKEGVSRLKAGDVAFIPSGEEYCHKAILGKGENVRLLLFEII